MLRDVFLSLGTNLGDRGANLRRAVSELESELGTALSLSGVYETEPWGYTDQPAFLNMCAKFRSDRSPEELLAVVKGIEARMGRQEAVRWGPRLIDIDLLKVGRLRRKSGELELPHPRMRERAFVMVPLADIAPRMRIPAGKDAGSVAGLARKLDLAGKVRKTSDADGLKEQK